MASQASNVGALPLPVAAGVANARLADPMVDALLDYVAFWIKDSLDAQLAQQTGFSSDAVPVGHRFPFDPMHPQGVTVEIPAPALFLWWAGQSSRIEWTTVHDVRQRELHMMYVAEELPNQERTIRRAGLLGAVDAAMFKAGQRRLHPSYTPTQYGEIVAGAAAGMSVTQAIADLGAASAEYTGGQVVRVGVNDDDMNPALPPGERDSGRDFPALLGVWLVREKVLAETLDGSLPFAGTEGAGGDAMPDLLFNISAGDGESEQVAPFMDRVLGAPDGSKVICEDDE